MNVNNKKNEESDEPEGLTMMQDIFEPKKRSERHPSVVPSVPESKATKLHHEHPFESIYTHLTLGCMEDDHLRLLPLIDSPSR